jgi:hypothetical protein
MAQHATEPSDLAKLAKPFPRELVQGDPGGNSYVAHENVTQWLLGIVGPFDYELREIIRGDVPGQAPNPKGNSKRAKDGTPDLHNVIVGGVWRLHLLVDGRDVVIEEAGDVEDPHNWRHDGARLKQAASDAIKRCAMRAGLGLHLWAGERYMLDKRLANGNGTARPAPEPQPADPEPAAPAQPTLAEAVPQDEPPEDLDAALAELGIRPAQALARLRRFDEFKTITTLADIADEDAGVAVERLRSAS